MRARRLNLLDDERVRGVLVAANDQGAASDTDSRRLVEIDAVAEAAPWAIAYVDQLGAILEAEGMTEQLYGVPATTSRTSWPRKRPCERARLGCG